MANGTMISCAEYYHDTVTYTGDVGSETNPYACEDVYDLFSIDSTCSNDAHVKLVNDIDFNDHSTAKYGINKYVVQDEVDLIGNGKSINNVIINNVETYGIFCCKISDAKIQNLIIKDFSPTNYKRIFHHKLTHCFIGVTCLNGYLRSLFHGDDDKPVNECTFNISGIGKDGACFSGGYGAAVPLNRCHVNYSNYTINANAHVFSSGVKISNSYFTGKIKYAEGKSPSNLFDSGSVSDSYFTFELDKEVDSIGLNPNNTSFYDNEKISVSNEPPENMKSLTTAQCKSASYLQSIGFPVIGGTS